MWGGGGRIEARNREQSTINKRGYKKIYDEEGQRVYFGGDFGRDGDDRYHDSRDDDLP